MEFLALGGDGNGIPVRATITSFGPILLSRVMELNDTQESSLQLVFHFADKNNLELIDLKDLRAVIQFLTSDEGKDELEELGGLSKATAGVILRELVTLEAQGMETFFGEPEFDTAELLRTAPDGRGVITCLELPTLQTKPMLFSTFLMWLLADLFEDLPEAGDLDKPKLVFFLDEAHLLFNDASKAFLEAITTTVRLIRSKGVGIFFVTQTPKDVPADVLGQLANRDPARAAGLHSGGCQGPEGHRLHLPGQRLRPRGDTHVGRHRRSRHYGDERKGRPHAGCVDPAAGTGISDGSQHR